MKYIASDESGWIQLYFDKETNSYYEKTYPDSEMQGGGNPVFTLISEDEAKIKYKI